MAKTDINLFKAAGGERAKSTKRSPVTIMLLIGIVIVIAALGVAVYFNIKVNSANSDYAKLQKIQNNYSRTLADPDIEELSKEYKTVQSTIESTKASNSYIERASALYPEATKSEVKAIRNTIRNNPMGLTYTITTSPEEDAEDRGVVPGEESEEEYEEEEPLDPIDYEALRAHLYDEDVDVSDKNYLYSALEALQIKQENEDYNVWYAYYRCYFVAVFTGEDGGIPKLISALADPTTGTMGGQTPFSRYLMENDVYVDDVYYVPAIFESVPFDDVYYHILLLPLKSVIERAYDILSAHSNALVETNHWEGQPELAAFYVTDIVFNNEKLQFNLYLPDDDALLEGYMSEIDASYFFDVDWSVVLTDGNKKEGSIGSVLGYDNLTVYFEITLNYKNRPELETAEEE